MRRNHGIRSLRGQGIPRYAIGGDIPDPDDPPMTITAEGVPITLDAPQRGWRSRINPVNKIRNMLGGLMGLGGWEMARDRIARGIENADLGPLRALGVLPEGVRERMANVFDESRLTADDLPGNVHDFAKMIAGQALTKAGPDADINRGGRGTHIPYPTQGFAAEHFDPSLMDRLVGKILGTDIDADAMSPEQHNEAFGFMEPSGWGATFGQGTMYEDPEGNVHFTDRYNFPNMTAGQLPNRFTGMEPSLYARGVAPHDAEQYKEDIAALRGEDKPFGRRMTNVLRHHMSEFGSTETDPTEGRSWDINLGSKDDLLASFAEANEPRESRFAGLMDWLGELGGRGGDSGVPSRVASAPSPEDGDELQRLRRQLSAPPSLSSSIPSDLILPGTPSEPSGETVIQKLLNRFVSR